MLLFCRTHTIESRRARLAPCGIYPGLSILLREYAGGEAFLQGLEKGMFVSVFHFYITMPSNGFPDLLYYREDAGFRTTGNLCDWCIFCFLFSFRRFYHNRFFFHTDKNLSGRVDPIAPRPFF